MEESSPGARSEKPYKELQLGGRERRERLSGENFHFHFGRHREKANWNVFAEKVTPEISWECLVLVQMEIKTGR